MAVTPVGGNARVSPLFTKRLGFVRKNASIFLIYGFIILIAGIAAFYSETFRTASNVANILRQSIILGLIAIGQSMVVLTGGMDISIDMIARTVAVVVATLFATFESDSTLIVPLLFLGMAVGVILGGLNGVLITRTHTEPVYHHLRDGEHSTRRQSCHRYHAYPRISSYLRIYDAKIGIVAINVIVMGFVWFAVWLFSTRTRLGRSLFAVGGSERVAQLSAIRVNRTLVSAYVLSGFFAALAGLFVLARMGVGDPSTAEGMTFQSIVAVAVGGISLYGGKGSLIGTLGGVLLLSMLSNVFNLMQVNIYYQQLLLGLVVLIAVAAYRSTRSVRPG